MWHTSVLLHLLHDFVVALGIISENDYDASAPQRQNEVQVAFVNDIYGDVRQMEGEWT